jgi:hypothetical protein
LLRIECGAQRCLTVSAPSFELGNDGLQGLER